MIRTIARGAALIAVGVDLTGAWLIAHPGPTRVPLKIAAAVTAAALIPCALAFGATVTRLVRQRGMRPHSTIDTMRLPLGAPRGYLGAAVLGGMAVLTAMGQPFALYIFAAGVALIALALSQARPRR